MDVETDWDALQSCVNFFLGCLCSSDWVRFVSYPGNREYSNG